jgi:hypothetical protein
LVGTEWSATLLGSQDEPASHAASSAQAAVGDASEAQERTSRSMVMVSAGEPSASATGQSRLPVARSRFTLGNDIFATTASLAAADAHVWRGTPEFVSVESATFAQRGGYRSRGRGRNGGARAAIALGAVASIAGAAVLVYANRPECRDNQAASGCGYGPKVVGGAVLSAGLVGLIAGALTWR